LSPNKNDRIKVSNEQSIIGEMLKLLITSYLYFWYKLREVACKIAWGHWDL